MPRIIDVNASIPARFTTVDVVARLVGPSDGRHSPVPSLGSDSEDEPPNVAYLRATAGCRCAAAFFRLTSLHWRDHTWSTSYSGTHTAAHTTCTCHMHRWWSVSCVCRLLLISAVVIAAVTGLSMLLGSRQSPAAAASAAATATATATATGALAKLLPAQLLPAQSAIDWQSTATVGWPPYQSGAPVPPPPWWARSPPPPPPPCPPAPHAPPPPPPLRKEGPRRAL